MTTINDTIKIQKINKEIEMLRKELEELSKGKTLHNPEVIELSNKLDAKIVRFMKLYGKLKS